MVALCDETAMNFQNGKIKKKYRGYFRGESRISPRHRKINRIKKIKQEFPTRKNRRKYDYAFIIQQSFIKHSVYGFMLAVYYTLRLLKGQVLLSRDYGWKLRLQRFWWGLITNNHISFDIHIAVLQVIERPLDLCIYLFLAYYLPPAGL